MARQVTRKGDVEIGSDLDFERRWRHVQQALWITFGVLVALGLAGLFGRGPLARARAGSETDPIQVEYDRFNASAKLKVTIRAARAHCLRVSLFPAKRLSISIRSFVTPFEFILLFLLGGIGIQAVLGADRSFTNAILGLMIRSHDVLVATLKQRFEALGKVIDGTPVVVYENGEWHEGE